MYRFGRWLSRLTDITTLVGGLALFVMMLHITLDVLLRFLFSSPIPGTIAYVSNYYMIVATFIPLAYAEKRGAHISVEVVTERFPPRVQYHLANLLLPVCGVVLGLMTVKTGIEAVSQYQMGAALMEGNTSIVIWPSYFMLPLGLGLMVVVVTYKFIVYLTGGRDGLQDPPQASADEGRAHE